MNNKSEIIRATVAILAVVATLAFATYIMVHNSNHPYNPALANVREDYGMITKSDEYETEVVTSDRITWRIKNYMCQPGSYCRIVFRTQNTDNPSDDEIILINPDPYYPYQQNIGG